jgi:GAF domain-containing protein
VDESLVVVPLRYGSRVIGTVALAKLGIDQFDGDDIRVLEVLASHAAVAMENARLSERERTAAHVAQELVKLSQALTGVHDVQGVLREALRAIPAMIECSDVLVYLRGSDTGDFRLAASETSGAETKLPTVVSADAAEGFCSRWIGRSCCRRRS